MSPLAEALGFGPYERVLIPHLDDVGMAHGANRAFLDTVAAGFLRTGSVMVPCPWFPEIARMAADPALDLGVHLTLTSEWQGYRWRPISTASPASGLIDADGYMWRDCVSLRRHVVPEAAEVELRAQIDRALAVGIDATHLDTHMGAALVPELAAIYLRLGQEYRLPVLLPRWTHEYLGRLSLGEIASGFHAPLIEALDRSGAPAVDGFRMTPGVPSEEVAAVYTALIGGIPPGVTFLSLHAHAPGDIETIVPERAHWRTDEHALLTDPAFAAWVEAQGIRSIGYRPIRELLRAATPARRR